MGHHVLVSSIHPFCGEQEIYLVNFYYIILRGELWSSHKSQRNHMREFSEYSTHNAVKTVCLVTTNVIYVRQLKVLSSSLNPHTYTHKHTNRPKTSFSMYFIRKTILKTRKREEYEVGSIETL